MEAPEGWIIVAEGDQGNEVWEEEFKDLKTVADLVRAFDEWSESVDSEDVFGSSLFFWEFCNLPEMSYQSLEIFSCLDGFQHQRYEPEPDEMPMLSEMYSVLLLDADLKEKVKKESSQLLASIKEDDTIAPVLRDLCLL